MNINNKNIELLAPNADAALAAVYDETDRNGGSCFERLRLEET